MTDEKKYGKCNCGREEVYASFRDGLCSVCQAKERSRSENQNM